MRSQVFDAPDMPKKKLKLTPNEALCDRLEEIRLLAWIAQKGKGKARTKLLKKIEELSDVCVADLYKRMKIRHGTQPAFGLEVPFSDLDIPF